MLYFEALGLMLALAPQNHEKVKRGCKLGFEILLE